MYAFGSYRLDPTQLRLAREGQPVPLQDLPLRLLIELVERRGELVTREELHRRLWPEESFLEFDNSLNAAMSRLRQALGDSAAEPRFIETVPKRGYRFVAPVEAVEPESGVRLAGRRWRPGHLLAVGGFAVVVLVVAVLAPRPLGQREGRASGETGVEEPPEELRQMVLRARHFADQGSREGLEKSIAEYQSALTLDPEHAPSYAGLALSYALLGGYDYWRPKEAFPPARRMAARALQLDPSSAEAHLATSVVDALYAWDWNGALAASENAVALGGDLPEARQWRGILLAALGRADEAEEELQVARRLDPLSVTVLTDLCWVRFLGRRWMEAVAACEEAENLDPTHFDAPDNLKWIYLTLAMEPEALAAWERALPLERGDPVALRERYREAGLDGLLADAIESKLARQRKGEYQSAYDLAIEYAVLEDRENALLWLERSFAERETDLVMLATDPRLDLLRGEERFQAMLREMGLDSVRRPPRLG